MAKSRHNDQKPALPQVLDALIETLLQALQQRDRLQVGTGAERAAGAGQYRNALPGVCIERASAAQTTRGSTQSDLALRGSAVRSGAGCVALRE